MQSPPRLLGTRCRRAPLPGLSPNWAAKLTTYPQLQLRLRAVHSCTPPAPASPALPVGFPCRALHRLRPDPRPPGLVCSLSTVSSALPLASEPSLMDLPLGSVRPLLAEAAAIPTCTKALWSPFLNQFGFFLDASPPLPFLPGGSSEHCCDHGSDRNPTTCLTLQTLPLGPPADVLSVAYFVLCMFPATIWLAQPQTMTW